MKIPPRISELIKELEGHKHVKIGKVTLTRRQAQVFICLAIGLYAKEAGDVLGISEKMVEHHRQDLYDILQTHSKVAVVHYAIMHKIVVAGEFV